jgi:hypothetical protein
MTLSWNVHHSFVTDAAQHHDSQSHTCCFERTSLYTLKHSGAERSGAERSGGTLLPLTENRKVDGSIPSLATPRGVLLTQVLRQTNA